MRESSAIYMVSTTGIFEQQCHLMLRSRENAYGSHPERKHKSGEERGRLWDSLKGKIARTGFDRNKPITIQLLRKNGKDKIKDGHHRFAIARELGIAEIPVRFLFDN